MKVKSILLLWLLSCANYVTAQIIQDSVKIHFQQGKTDLDMNIGNNYAVLQGISERLNLNFNDSTYYRLRKVLVIGGASPEGSITLNKRLSEKRAETLFNHLAQYGTFPDSLRHYTFLGRDWNGLIRLAEEDLELPYRDETLALLRDIAGDARNSVSGKTDAVRRLQALRGGQPYRYMYRHHFPILRASSMYLWYSEVKLPYHSTRSSLRKPADISFPVLEAPPLYVYEPEKEEAPAMYWALKTNLLYDALLVPNVGVEFYVGKNWSVATDWMYAWWKNDVNRRWRVYGGDLAVRRWFGRKAEAKPLTGHHLGLYAQLLTYDFCLDEKGYMGGKPGGNLWDKLNYALGVEYGYSLPAGRYHSIVYNQSPTEFGSVSFRGMDKYETAEVYANLTDSHWYVARGDEEGRVVTSPEWLATDRVEDMRVTQEMVEKTGQEYLVQLTEGRSRVDNSYLIGEHIPQNIIYTVTVKVHIKGIYNLRSSRASLTGLAEGYWLGKGKSTGNKVTQLIEGWKTVIDPEDPTRGTIVAQITCFGLPEGHQKLPEENTLDLSILLVDNKTVLNFPFLVGDKFKESINENVQLSLSLELEVTIEDPLPDVEPEGGSGSGFDATVDDWGDEENIDVNM